jgi:hypothetical protein
MKPWNVGCIFCTFMNRMYELRSTRILYEVQLRLYTSSTRTSGKRTWLCLEFVGGTMLAHSTCKAEC